MLLIAGSFRVPVAALDAVRPAMTAMVTASRAEDGCIEYGYAHDLLDPGLILVRERWRDRAALAVHAASDHIAAWRAVWPVHGLIERALTLFEVEAGEPV